MAMLETCVQNLELEEDTPRLDLLKIAAQQQLEIFSHQFAQFMDKNDPLAHLRQEFFYPKMKDLPHGNFSNFDIFTFVPYLNNIIKKISATVYQIFHKHVQNSWSLNFKSGKFELWFRSSRPWKKL